MSSSRGAPPRVGSLPPGGGGGGGGRRRGGGSGPPGAGRCHGRAEGRRLPGCPRLRERREGSPPRYALWLLQNGGFLPKTAPESAGRGVSRWPGGSPEGRGGVCEVAGEGTASGGVYGVLVSGADPHAQRYGGVSAFGSLWEEFVWNPTSCP